MRLAPRLIAATAGTVFAASALAGTLLYRLEREQLLTDEVTESRLLLRSIQVSVENAMRDGQDPDIAELLDRMEATARRVDVLVYPEGSERPRQASLGSAVDDEGVARVRRRTESEGEVHQILDAPGEPPRLVAGTPLRTDGGTRIGTLVMNRPLVELEADLGATARLILVSVFTFAGLTTMVMLVFLRREVTEPVDRIVTAARQVGETLDAGLRIRPAPSDDLDVLRTTLLRMQRQLQAARRAREEEARRREAMDRQLRDADKLIVVGQLAAGVAHEVGSPLQVMIGRARILASGQRDAEDVRRQAGLIVEHAERIAGIVERLQDVARRRPSRRRPTDLVHPVEQVMWLLAPEAKRQGVRLSWDLPDTPVQAQADPDEVQQVVLNLALNAIQATPRDGRVAVGVEHREDGPVVWVRDTGRGMDGPTRDRAFEPFFTTRVEARGTGLGLAVVKSIVDRHRARIVLRSAPGEGTEVTVTWPREAP